MIRRSAGKHQPFWVCEECEGVWLGMDVGPSPDRDLELLLAELEVAGGMAALQSTNERFVQHE